MSPAFSPSSALTRRQLLGASGVSAAALLLAACGGSSSGSGGGSGGSGGGSGDLSWFMWSGSTTEVNAWKHCADLVHAADAKTTLSFQTTTFNDYWTKLTSQASSGKSADILGMQAQRAPQFNQLLVPLDDKLDSLGVSADMFADSIWAGMKVNGKVVALPYDFGPYLIYYNKTAFEAAGLPIPAQGWTQDDFMTAAKKLTSGNKFGFWAQAVIDSVMPFVLSQHGEAAVSDSGDLQMDSAAWKATCAWYGALVSKEKVAAKIPATGSPTAATNQFLAGNAMMCIDGPWSLINAKATAKFDVGIAPVPAGASGSKTMTAGSGFGISTSCKDPDRAAKAIAVLTGTDAEAYLGKAGRAFPSRTAQQASWYEGNNLADAKAAMDYSIANSIPFRTTAKWTSVNDTFGRYAVTAFNGDSDVNDMLSRVQASGK
jgi:multiple sugar transport system substrate-binding protein